MSKTSLLFVKYGSVIGFIMMITVNALANIMPINGKTTGELSDSYPNLFVPAGLTFSVWGVIYLLLLLYTIYQTGLVWKHSDKGKDIIGKAGVLYIISCIANTAWIFFWHYQMVFISVIVIVLLLITLISIYLKTRVGKDATFREKLCISFSFSVYLGWITVATIANITAWLVDIKWDGWGIAPQIWTAIVIIIAVLITALFQKRFKDVFYSAVVFWALLGILIRHIGILKSQYPMVIYTTVLGMVIILSGLVIIITGRMNTKYRT